MSDFFANLIATHLLQTNVLQPQRPALFEPTSLTAGSLEETTGEGLTQANPTPHAPEIRAHPLPLLLQASEPIAPSGRPRSNVLPSSIESAAPYSTTPAVTPVSTTRESQQHETHTNAEKVEEATTTHQIVVAPVIRSRVETTSASRETTAPRTIQVINPPRIRSTIEPPAPAAAPSVNVTIGRLEVRATTTPAPVREARRTSKVMSLEDYLHQRNREAQR